MKEVASIKSTNRRIKNLAPWLAKILARTNITAGRSVLVELMKALKDHETLFAGALRCSTDAPEKIPPGKKVRILVNKTIDAINAFLGNWNTITGAVNNIACPDGESEIPPIADPNPPRISSTQVCPSVD